MGESGKDAISPLDQHIGVTTYMKLTKIYTDTRSDKLIFCCDVETRSDSEGFTITFEISPILDLSLGTADPFVLPCLLMAMERREDLDIAVPVSARLFHSVRTLLVPVLGKMLSLDQNIRVRASKTTSEGYSNNLGVIAGFSGGIDSYAMLRDHYFEAPVPEYKLTHLLFNDVGSHNVRVKGQTEKGQEIYSNHLARIQCIANQLQLPLIRVRSNIDPLLRGGWRLGFGRTHTIRHVSIALLMQSICRQFYYASGFSYVDLNFCDVDDISRGDPVLLQLCSTESMDCLSVGGQYTRVEKTQIVADMPLAHQTLDVCWGQLSDKINCGRCSKCKRTILTLEILGKLQFFEKVFDLEAYYKERSAFIAQVLSSERTLLVEIRDLARSRGYRFPTRAHIQSYLSDLPFKKAIPASVKQAMKRLLTGNRDL